LFNRIRYRDRKLSFVRFRHASSLYLRPSVLDIDKRNRCVDDASRRRRETPPILRQADSVITRHKHPRLSHQTQDRQSLQFGATIAGPIIDDDRFKIEGFAPAPRLTRLISDDVGGLVVKRNDD
jgi:hypothetical protein